MDAEVAVAAIDGVDEQLARVDEVLMVGIALEGMPAIFGMKLEEANVIGDFIGRIVLPRTAGNAVGHKRPHQGAGFQDQLARVDAESDAVVPQAQTAAPGMDARVYIQRSKYRVVGAGGGLGHKGVVQAGMVAVARLSLDMAVFLVHLRGLGKACLLLVQGLRAVSRYTGVAPACSSAP
jgi:hypothetical protein